MYIPATKYLIMLHLMIIGALHLPNLAAGDFTITDHQNNENSSHWVCDYTQGQYDVLLLRCDNLVGLLYDHMLLKDGPLSKTRQYIPIWRRAKSDKAAINLVKKVLCVKAADCKVEMVNSWAANYY